MTQLPLNFYLEKLRSDLPSLEHLIKRDYSYKSFLYPF